MTHTVLKGFESLETHHCVTGSMRHIYVYHNHPISEEMLLGLGEGVGFIFCHMKGTDPFIGGRGKGRPRQGFERRVGERTGVLIEEYTTASARKAEDSLMVLLAAGQPVMVQVDMGFLPYFDFGGYDYHFGAHVIVVCGYDNDTHQITVADREKELHSIQLDELRRARGSQHKPFAPQHRWFTFDFTKKRMPTSEEVVASIKEQTKEMLAPPIKNIGVEGIKKAAHMIPQWLMTAESEAVRRVLFNFFVFIDYTGGTGGGLFRYMFSRFLNEASRITGIKDLEQSSAEFKKIGDQWQALSTIFYQGSEEGNSTSLRSRIKDALIEISDLEYSTWLDLQERISGYQKQNLGRG
jgi:hypothetical protein